MREYFKHTLYEWIKNNYQNIRKDIEIIYNKIKLIIKTNINELQIKEETISILNNIYENIQEIKINNNIKEILIFNSIENDLINQDEFEVNKTDIEEVIQLILN